LKIQKLPNILIYSQLLLKLLKMIVQNFKNSRLKKLGIFVAHSWYSWKALDEEDFMDVVL